jgi:YggT family protein
MNLGEIILYILNILSLLLLARALFSWVDPGMNSQIGSFLRNITEPIVAPVRQVVPPMGGLDLSIMVTMLLLIVLRQLIAQSLV